MTIAEQDQLSGEHPELVVAGLEAERYVLVLFVSGACESSARAIANIREICDQHLIGRHHLTIVDVNQEPSMASRHHVLATPTLIKDQPLPTRMLVGDMSDHERILTGIDVHDAEVPDRAPPAHVARP
jgi:circadian clock protein KaiB